MAERLALPPVPVQVKVKVLLALVSAPVLALPLVALLPLHAPLAVQLVASVLDQVRVEELPLVTDVGFALKDTVGAGAAGVTVTDAERLMLPPLPVQVSVNVLLAVSAPVDWFPEVALLPDQAPDAVQESAPLDVQVKVEGLPLVTVVGLADRLKLGAGALTETVTDRVTLPPLPVQVSEKSVVTVKAPVDCVPDVAFVPDQPPDALQLVASVDDHVRLAALPLATLVGLALRLKVGAEANTVTVTERVALPPVPEQLSV